MQAPPELQQLFNIHNKALLFFESLAFTHRREYVEWILSAKRDETRQQRLQITIEKLIACKKIFNEK